MIGDNIKKYRKIAGLTQEQLASKIGVAVVTIRQYENNSREPKIDTLNKIAKILDVDILQLISSDLPDRKQDKRSHAFDSILQSIGYDVIDLTVNPGGDSITIIQSGADGTEIPLRDDEYKALMEATEEYIESEISRLMESKGIEKGHRSLPNGTVNGTK